MTCLSCNEVSCAAPRKQLKPSGQIEVFEAEGGSASGDADARFEEVIAAVDSPENVFVGIAHSEIDIEVRGWGSGDRCFGGRIAGEGESSKEG